MAPSGVHSRSVRTPKRVPFRVSFSIMVRARVGVEFRHSELVLEFRHSELQYEFRVSELTAAFFKL